MDNVILTTYHLTKKYRDTVANDGITISVPRGKIIGFVGENGSGKTTLLRTVTGLIKPTSGSFRYHTESGSCRVGAIVESPALFPGLSAYDNLAFQARLCGAPLSDIPDLLETVGLTGTGKKKAKQFSLGMRQRLGIAVALLSKPDLLILDEPTNGLDPQGIIELRKMLRSLCDDKGMTILISSHILSELSQLADAYLFLHKGRISETSTASELSEHATKELRFQCRENAENAVKAILEKGYAEKASPVDGGFVLYDPKDYSGILRELSVLEITDLETRKASLESHYLEIMNKEEKS